MARGILHVAPTLRAAAVPHAPRPVPLPAVARNFLLPLATGAAWMAVGAVALIVARSEGLPPPESANFGSGLAWLLGLSLVVAGGTVVSWALLRSTEWSRVQRRGCVADATVMQVHAVSWLRVSGHPPLDVGLTFADERGQSRSLRLRLPMTWSRRDVAVGDTLVVVYERHRPQRAALYWKS